MSISDSEDDDYFGSESAVDDHRGDATPDPASLFNIKLIKLDKEPAEVSVSKTESLEALLRKIAGNYNPTGIRYLLNIKDGNEIDLDEDDLTMEQLGLDEGSVLVMTVSASLGRLNCYLHLHFTCQNKRMHLSLELGYSGFDGVDWDIIAKDNTIAGRFFILGQKVSVLNIPNGVHKWYFLRTLPFTNYFLQTSYELSVILLKHYYGRRIEKVQVNDDPLNADNT
ncbi:hypothetical protein BC937DRAFT_92037 [Endogone sp. FLAS-F59071]|nr:hypothetical protein BC937DRAFT_92037 [Endogone sp. FLAS-F59071]|eukprot:RUS21626.1 hypothetical protein BC937DRAFT_92037 [Endogone sp. FLAS-F59071]